MEFRINTVIFLIQPNIYQNIKDIWDYSFYFKVKLATVVKGDQKAPFSIATKQKCRGVHYSFPTIASLYPWYVPYIAEC